VESQQWATVQVLRSQAVRVQQELTMTDKEKQAAEAYIKLHDDVRQLIVDTVYKELQTYGGLVQNQVKTAVLLSPEMEQRVKDIVRNQMMKY
jgi:hypothetical protein